MPRKTLPRIKSVTAGRNPLTVQVRWDTGDDRLIDISGVIDSFQYYGAAIALPITGRLIHHYGWGMWYPTMASFGIIGGCAMLLVMRKQRYLTAQAATVAAV